jgi:predicted glutamine amidotransferase
MCRLLGYVTRSARPIAQSLGTDLFDEFTSLARLHADGWGMAWHGDDGGVHGERSPDAATEDSAYRRLSGTALSRCGLVHLRWATDGLAVDASNTHPFVEGDLALAHNGSIAPIPGLEGLLRPEFAEKLVGTTDSERYFRLVMQCIADAGDVDTGIIEAVTLLHATFPSSSLNAIILAPNRLAAVHVNAAATGPLGDLRDLYAEDADAPPGHLESYFTMSVAAGPDSVHVASSGIRGPGWEPIAEDAILLVDADTLVRRTVTISPVAATSGITA